MTKTQLFKVLLIILGLAMISVTGYAVWKINKDINKANSEINWFLVKQKTQKENGLPEKETPTKETEALEPRADTSDWNTYRNEEYGFEVRYPINWKYRLQNLEYNFNSKNQTLLTVFFEKEDCSCIWVNVYDILNAPKGVPIGTKRETIIVDGITGDKYVRRQGLDIGGLDIVISVNLSHNGKVFQITYGRNSNEKSSEEVFNQMLKGFRFF